MSARRQRDLLRSSVVHVRSSEAHLPRRRNVFREGEAQQVVASSFTRPPRRREDLPELFVRIRATVRRKPFLLFCFSSYASPSRPREAG